MAGGPGQLKEGARHHELTSKAVHLHARAVRRTRCPYRLEPLRLWVAHARPADRRGTGPDIPRSSSSFEVHSKFKRNRLVDREITLPTLPKAVQIGPTVGELWRDRRVLRYVRGASVPSSPAG